MPFVAVQNKTWFNPWRDIFDCHRSASCNTGYAGCVQLLDGHGVVINARATFELLLVRRPILSVSRLVEKGFAVVMGKEAAKHVEQGRESDTSAQIQWCVPRTSLVKRPCHGHDTNPQRTRDWHTRLATCLSELGVRTV